MRTPKSLSTLTIKLHEDSSLIAIPSLEDGEDVTYFYVEREGDTVEDAAELVKRARSLAGAWSDLDWDEMLESLSRNEQ